MPDTFLRVLTPGHAKARPVRVENVRRVQAAVPIAAWHKITHQQPHFLSGCRSIPFLREIVRECFDVVFRFILEHGHGDDVRIRHGQVVPPVPVLIRGLGIFARLLAAVDPLVAAIEFLTKRWKLVQSRLYLLVVLHSSGCTTARGDGQTHRTQHKGQQKTSHEDPP